MLEIGSCDTILLDIEGTTTPIDFVHKTLFPFAKNRLLEYLSKNAGTDDLISDLEQLRTEYELDLVKDPFALPIDRFDASQYLNFLIETDRKSTALKSIQGKIWQEGYESGLLKGQVFDDVPVAFEQWSKNKIKLYIFSSGSILAQQLLFRYSTAGDLTKFIHGYFDTTTGPKRETKSYMAISDSIQSKPQNILFISDIPEELLSASQSGMSVLLSVRPGNSPVSNSTSFKRITSFA